MHAPWRFRVTLLATLLAPALALAQTQPQTPARDAADPPVARVDGQVLRLSDVLGELADLLPPEARGLPPAEAVRRIPPETLRQLTERAATERAFVNAARRAGLDKDPEVRRRVRRAEEQVLQQAYLARELGAGITEEAARERYTRDMASFQPQEEVRARHILLRTEAEARRALEEVQRGADFAEVAGRVSIDPGGKSAGGDLGFFKRSDVVPEFAAAAFALQEGQLTPDPVRSSFGWHVIRLEARRSGPRPDFAEVREALQEHMAREQMSAVVQRVRAAAGVELIAPPPAAGGLLDGATPPPAGRGSTPSR
jgi:peptidyl-prolyl cis-trans isomerase C